MSQKDVHFYFTRYMLLKLGIEPDWANQCAWACQYVDDQTQAPPGRLQTQCAIDPAGNWRDPHIQTTVLAAFHFLPGDKSLWPWMTTPACKLSLRLLRRAKDPYELGLAIHSFQDTYSHQNFTPFVEKLNSCFGWDNLVACGIPSIGHADVRRAPDVMNSKWVDPRSRKVINNATRGKQMAAKLYGILYRKQPPGKKRGATPEAFKEHIEPFFKSRTYEMRKIWLLDHSGDRPLRYRHINAQTGATRSKQFNRAALKHVATAMQHFPSK